MPKQSAHAREFSRSRRLLSTSAFDDLQKSGRKQHSAHFAVRWSLQKVADVAGQSQSRIGLIVGKKQLRRAVDRNAVKRVLRELFRQSTLANLGVDLTVRFVTVVKPALTLKNKQPQKFVKGSSVAADDARALSTVTQQGRGVASNDAALPLLPRARVTKKQLAADFNQLIGELAKRVIYQKTHQKTHQMAHQIETQNVAQTAAQQSVQLSPPQTMPPSQ